MDAPGPSRRYSAAGGDNPSVLACVRAFAAFSHWGFNLVDIADVDGLALSCRLHFSVGSF
jgi:hypothetical protein